MAKRSKVNIKPAVLEPTKQKTSEATATSSLLPQRENNIGSESVEAKNQKTSFIGSLLERLPENNRLERIWKIAVVDFKKRYYNDNLGLIWALINPLSQIAVYYLVFTRVFPRNKPNFALFLFSGILIWMAFAEATIIGSKLIKTKKYLLEGIQFKWTDLYLSHMISSSFGLIFNLCAYQVIALMTGVFPNINIVLLPMVLLQWFLISYAMSMILGVIAPIFDDFVHIWSIVILIGFWTSGIFFSGEFYLDKFSWYLYVNPFVGMILNIRSCLLVGNSFYPDLLLLNFVQCIVLFLFARYTFKKLIHKGIERL